MMLSDGKPDAAIEAYEALRPTRYHDLIKFEVRVDNWPGGDGVILEIDLAAKNPDEKSVLRIRFLRIGELKYEPGLWSFCYIQIVTMPPQWEFVRYRAFETEQDTRFSVHCQSFEAQIIPLSSIWE